MYRGMMALQESNVTKVFQYGKMCIKFEKVKGKGISVHCISNEYLDTRLCASICSKPSYTPYIYLIKFQYFIPIFFLDFWQFSVVCM
jgi:hypothetical protein